MVREKVVVGPEQVLSFWLDEVGPSGWYEVSDELDARIREKFYDTWAAACGGGLGLWLTYPSGALAYTILMDQFPRNMFRGEIRAFATDRIAKAVAKTAIHRNWDLRIDEPARQFFYLPLMHSESLCDQEHCVRLICERMPQTGEDTLLHAQAHREVIRRFGRFPYRNAVLGRLSNKLEKQFLDSGGYASVVRARQKVAA